MCSDFSYSIGVCLGGESSALSLGGVAVDEDFALLHLTAAHKLIAIAREV